MFNFTIMIIFSLEKGEVLGNKRGKISRTNTNYNEHIRTIKNTRRLCATYISGYRTKRVGTLIPIIER